MAEPPVVVGIDVGGLRKGFHAVALREECLVDMCVSKDAGVIAQWCEDIGAQAIGIDAPCRWSATGRARQAERMLAATGIFAFATPSREKAGTCEFYRWMLNGAELYKVLERRYRLFDGHNLQAPTLVCFETFPHAVACALAGTIVSAKSKRSIRGGLLRQAGIDTSRLSNIDMIDAALCSLTANLFLAGQIKTYGDASEGIIVVPGLSSARSV